MREIKFRAWDLSVKEMYEDLCNASPKEGFWLNKEIEKWNSNQNIILMQFTGLHDKNGKEIYEGDIVHCADLGPVDMPLIKRTGHIEYEPNTCTFGVWVDWTEFGTSNDEARALFPMGHFRLSEYEVIGNIYENPELIEK